VFATGRSHGAGHAVFIAVGSENSIVVSNLCEKDPEHVGPLLADDAGKSKLWEDYGFFAARNRMVQVHSR
jgi:hypothetical protein